MKKLSVAAIDRLRAKLIKQRDVYHNTNTSLVPDEEYDADVDLLEFNVPDDPFFDEVGAELPKGAKKVKLPHLMPSLAKVRTGRGLEDFLKESSGEIVATIKLDGSSLMHKDINGKAHLFTRGNGSIGRDVSYLIPHLRGLGKLERNQAVRGEAMMAESDFSDAWAEKYKNSRGLVNGAVNASKVHESIGDIEFIAHSQVFPKLPWKKARVKLKQQGYNTVPTKILKSPTPAQLTKFLADEKAAHDYTLDGLVLEDAMSNKPISFKVDEDPIEVTVKRILWDISRHGLWKPTVILTKATIIGGVSVTRATAHNAKYVITHKIGPGAVLKIIRSGDVIPKVVGTVKGVKPQLPENFEWDAKKIEAIATDLTEDQEFRVTAKKLAESLKILKIEGARLQTAEKLVEAGFNDIVDLYLATYKAIAKSGIGDVASKNLYRQLQASIAKITHAQLMYASHIWPRGFAEDKFQLILDRVPFRTMAKAPVSKLHTVISGIRGMSVTSSKLFINGLDDYEDMLDDLGWMPKTPAKLNVTGEYLGKNFVFTKVRNKVLEQYLIARGAKISGSVNKDTLAVIVQSKVVNSVKSDKAKALGIPRYELPEFLAKFRIDLP